MLLFSDDTIVASATAPGRAALAVVRMSGRDAMELASRLCDRWIPGSRSSFLTKLRDPRSGDEIDTAIVTRRVGPRSYTGEDVVEFSCHGGSAVVAALLDAAVALGARPASHGEFTRRAVAHGKVDLLQAEAIGDLIDAPSQAARRQALRQMHGELSRHIARLRDEVLEIEALIAYEVDFPEEDDGPIPAERVTSACGRAIRTLDEMVATAPLGELMRDGVRVVIAGAPNSGKSSLFNALLGQRRAIVSAVPGTTRDAVEARVDIGPWTVCLVDTAGLRESDDAVERLGIEVSGEQLDAAHVVLVCGESAEGLASARMLVSNRHAGPSITVQTKSDLRRGEQESGHSIGIRVSAVERTGLDELQRELATAVAKVTDRLGSDAPVVTRARHREILTRAREELDSFRTGWQGQVAPAIVLAVHVRAARDALDELVGTISVADVLDRVFSTFCIGK